MATAPGEGPRVPRELACALAVAVVFAVITCGLLAPALADPTRLALGHEGNDVWNHVWGYWYVYDALVHGRLPLETDLLRWPVGGSLWFIDTVGAVLTLPIQWAWGPVAAS